MTCAIVQALRYIFLETYVHAYLFRITRTTKCINVFPSKEINRFWYGHIVAKLDLQKRNLHSILPLPVFLFHLVYF